MANQFQIVTPLWDHQKQLVGFAKQHDKTLWLAGCGVGKTLSALTVAQDCFRILVLTTKAGITSAWEQDIEKHTKELFCLPLIKGTSKQKAKLLADCWDIVRTMAVVVNYETARLLPLGNYDWDIAIADESHKLKSFNSKTSQQLAAACRHIPRKIAMTGTAWEDRPTDIYGQDRWLDPEGNGNRIKSARLGSWTEFFDEYVEWYPLENLKIPTGYKNQDKLNKIISQYTYFVDGEKVLDLPEQHFIPRYVDLGKEQRQLYNQMEDNFIARLADDNMTADNVLVQALRLHQLTGGVFVGDDGTWRTLKDQPKLDMLLAILDEIGGLPAVVFTRFKSDVAAIAQALTKEKITYRVLTGEKHEHVEWQKGEGQVMIANIAAGSASVDFTRARNCIYYALTESRTDYVQSLSRTRRPGADLRYSSNFYQILARETIDEHILAALQTKGRWADDLKVGLVTHAKPSQAGKLLELTGKLLEKQP